MKYWYLKNGDVIGPMSAEEIKKDESFAEDCLVCPEDKAEQPDFWKTPQNYSQDFANVLAEEEEMELPQEEVSLDDFSFEESEERNITAQAQSSQEKSKIEEPQPSTEEKNPFEINNPSLGPDPEETFSSHEAAPRLDAKGDTLLEDIPAKAILREDNQEEEFSEDKTEENSQESSVPVSAKEEDPFEDTPILNIFERPIIDKRKTKEITDISEGIYDKYGSDNQDPPIHMSVAPVKDSNQREQVRKNNKIFLLLIIMFIVVLMALVVSLMSSEKVEEKTTAALPSVSAKQTSLVKNENVEVEDTPTIDASVFLTAKATDALEQERAIKKVKSFVLPTGQNLEEYLKQKYAAYQTSWSATLLSGTNYCVHFNARKIRQEPIVYSFSIDLDNNNINGLNNLGMDLLFKGE